MTAAFLGVVGSLAFVVACAAQTQPPAPAPPSAKAPNVKPRVYKMKPPTTAQIDASKAAAKQRGVGLLGVHLAVEPKALDKGKWQKLPDGRTVWMMRIESAGSTGVRVHFDKFDVGQGKVWVHSGQMVGGPYAGKGPNGDGEFWAEAIEASWAVVEYEPATGAKAGARPPFAIDKVAHQLAK